MPETMMFDWDSAKVKVTVPVHFTASTVMHEVEIPLASFARLLLTSVPHEWFAENDLPLAIDIPDPDVRQQWLDWIGPAIEAKP